MATQICSASLVLGLILVGGCAGWNDEPAEEPAAEPSVSAIGEDAPLAQPPELGVELPEVQKLLLREVFNRGAIDKETYRNIAEELAAQHKRTAGQGRRRPLLSRVAPAKTVSGTTPPISVHLETGPDGKLQNIHLSKTKLGTDLATFRSQVVRLSEKKPRTGDAKIKGVVYGCYPGCEHAPRCGDVIAVLGTLGAVFQGRGTFGVGSAALGRDFCCALSDAPLEDGFMVVVPILMTAKQDGSIDRIVVSDSVDLDDSISQLAEVVADSVAVARLVGKAQGSVGRLRIDLRCEPDLSWHNILQMIASFWWAKANQSVASIELSTDASPQRVSLRDVESLRLELSEPLDDEADHKLPVVEMVTRKPGEPPPMETPRRESPGAAPGRSGPLRHRPNGHPLNRISPQHRTMASLMDDPPAQPRPIEVEPADVLEKLEGTDIIELEDLPDLRLEPDKPPNRHELIAPDEDEAAHVDLADFGLTRAPPRNDLLATVGATALSGRGSGSRGRLAKKYGGSEAAVARALMWLTTHQCADGGWNFDLKKCPGCLGKCPNSGESGDARNAATAMALLPFLGAGQTHKDGKFKTQVNNGIRYLCRNMKIGPQGASLWEEGGRGQMYSHGLATIALCECYAMTRDRQLHVPAQGALNFVCSAQDPVGGGWRYKPREKGDTSVTSWQITALKTGQMAYLRVPPQTVKKASAFLDNVQSDGGAAYGYRGPDDRATYASENLGSDETMTAVGLLCRMRLGWKRDNPALIRGVERLAKAGPSPENLYYDYYATQVMFHYGGEPWKKWNAKMRDLLVNSQSQEGHSRGSWYLDDKHASAKGGRLYCTAMATLILETYYRYAPIYQTDAS